MQEQRPPGTPRVVVTEPVFRSINFYHEWNEDDQGNVQQVSVPKDDVLEGLKRREMGIGDGRVGATP